MVNGQFKIQQTAFMLIGVFFFFFMVFIIFANVQLNGIRKSSVDLEKDKSVMLSEFLAGTTEFSCPDKQYCIDTDKIMVLKNKTSFFDLWPVEYVKIRKVYPNDRDVECTTANYPDCNTYTLKSKKSSGNSSIGSFIALCRYEKKETLKQVCEIGRISIGYSL